MYTEGTSKEKKNKLFQVQVCHKRPLKHISIWCVSSLWLSFSPFLSDFLLLFSLSPSVICFHPHLCRKMWGRPPLSPLTMSSLHLHTLACLRLFPYMLNVLVNRALWIPPKNFIRNINNMKLLHKILTFVEQETRNRKIYTLVNRPTMKTAQRGKWVLKLTFYSWKEFMAEHCFL